MDRARFQEEFMNETNIDFVVVAADGREFGVHENFIVKHAFALMEKGTKQGDRRVELREPGHVVEKARAHGLPSLTENID